MTADWAWCIRPGELSQADEVVNSAADSRMRKLPVIGSGM